MNSLVAHSTVIVAVAWCAVGCVPHCTGDEGSSLETACAAWNDGRYEKFPKMCGISGKVGAKTSTWSDSDGACTCNVSRESLTGFYDLNDCSFVAAGGSGAAADMSQAVDAGGGSCVDLPASPSQVPAIAQAGAPPPSTGGTFLDGTYQVTAVAIYGTSDAAGTQLGTFGGTIKIAGSSFETSYGGPTVAAFYGKGTLSASSATAATVAFSCSSTGPVSVSYPYSVSGSTIVVTTEGAGYTSVSTYTAM